VIAALATFVERAAALGLDPAELWAAARVSPALLSDRNVRIDSDRFAEVIERAMELSGLEDFNVRVQDRLEGRLNATVSYVLAGAQDLGDAITRYLRHIPVWTEAVVPTQELGESSLRVSLAGLGPRRPGLLWRLAGVLGGLVSNTNRAMRAPWVPLEVELEVPEPRDTSALVRVFGPRIAFDRPSTALSIRAADLRIPAKHAPLRYPASIDALLDSPHGAAFHPTGDLVDVKRTLTALLPAGPPTLPELADSMGLTTSELRARLARAGVDYPSVLDEVRAEIASGLLRAGELSIGETASLAGYRDVAAFRRAYKRWTGETAGRAQRLRAQEERGSPRPSELATFAPSSSSSLVSIVVNGAADLGAPREELWRIAGIDPASADVPERVPSECFYAMVEVAVRLTGREDVCLRIREALDTTSFGVFGFAIATSVDLLDMFRRMHRFLAFWDELELETSRSPEGLVVRLRSHVAWRRGQELHLAAVLGNNLIQGWRLARHAFPVHSVKLPGAPPADLEVYARVFGPSIAFGAPLAELTVPEDELARPLTGPRSDAADVVGRYMEEQLEKVPREARSVRDVRATLASLLPGHEPRIEIVARHLRTSARTLQRRLGEEGVRFEDLVDDVRRELSMRHLRAGALSIAEVAMAAGFSDPSAFHRAFRRWSGLTPAEWRARSRPSVRGS
jgi:AraC-like DNA-binding protein